MVETQNESYPVITSQSLDDSEVHYSSKQDMRAHVGVIIMVDITASTGTSPTLTVALEEWVPQANAGAGRYVAVTGATTGALDATSVTNKRLIVYPGSTASANAAVNSPVAEQWRVSATVGGTGSPTVTASVHVTKLL